MSYSPGGAGGGGSLATDSDVTVSNPADTQVLAYDTTTEKWQNTDANTLPAAINQRTTSYTITSLDAGRIVTINSSSAATVTVNTGSNIAVGQVITIIQQGTGAVTISGSASIKSRGSATSLAGQYAIASLVCVAADSFVLSGDLS